MTFFKVLWAIDALGTLVILYFFVVGLGDNTVNERNGLMWMGILAACAAVLGGSAYLRSHQQPSIATVVAAIMAVPAVLFAVFFLIIILSGTKWQ